MVGREILLTLNKKCELCELLNPFINILYVENNSSLNSHQSSLMSLTIAQQSDYSYKNASWVDVSSYQNYCAKIHEIRRNNFWWIKKIKAINSYVLISNYFIRSARCFQQLCWTVICQIPAAEKQATFQLTRIPNLLATISSALTRSIHYGDVISFQC